ncbi:MAG: hypothetical protein ACO24B_01545 [Ilumatobacteraceae bacterium]
MAIAKGLAFYMNGVPLSCALQSFDATAETEALDATTLCNTARTYATGLKTGSVSASGIWDADTANENKIHDVFEKAYTDGTNNVVTATLESLAYDADAVMFNATQTTFGIEASTGQLIIASADFQTQSGINFGKVLFSANVDNTTTDGTSKDFGASSTGGALFQVQISNPDADTGSVKLQHSTDDAVWTDVTTITVTTDVYQAHSYEVPRGTTLNRYVRVQCTADNEEINFVAAVARR